MQNTNGGPALGNLILAMALSMGILLGWEYFVSGPQRDAARAQAAATQQTQVRPDGSLAPELPQLAAPAKQAMSREDRLAAAPRIPIRSERLHGSINLQGLRIDDLTLAGYHENVDTESDEVVLMSPAGGEASYFAEFGWLGKDVLLPNAQTVWQTDQRELQVNQPFVAYWENGQGLRFEREIMLDTDYLFTIQQRVINQSGSEITLYPYGLISRNFADEGKHFFILHEGPLGVFNETLEERSYEDIRDDGRVDYKGSKGWLGITDKYWLAALIPDPATPMNAKMKFVQSDGRDTYQVDYTAAAQRISAGERITVTQRLFAGAKEVSLLDRYMNAHQIPLFDRAVDFGWLYFLTKPIFHALDYFNGLLGNFGLAILALTVCIKLLLFPLANKSYKSMSQLKVLMPKITELKERHGDDKMALNQAIMKLYGEEKVNPASGCLPMLVQIPIFFALYKVLFVTIEMRHADFYGWINDLSAPDPTSVFNLFGLIPWDPPGFLMIGLWPLIMCATMVIQMRLNPKPADPAQAMVMQWLPFIFLFLFASFPAGLVIYWAWNNTLSILQQYLIMKRHGAR
jgi:YidC/Oxa1 family membrane protein insertase